MKKLVISDNKIQEVYNISNGVYAPLVGFLREEDFLGVLHSMRLLGGVVWSIPIVLDVSKNEYLELNSEKDLLLVNRDGEEVAVLKDVEIYFFDKNNYASSIFGTVDLNHPGVAELMKGNDYLVGGDVEVVNNKFDFSNFSDYYFTPGQTRKIFNDKGWKSVVAFQTRNVPHRSHEFLQKLALEEVDGLMVQPVIGKKKKGDFCDDVIIESYKILLEDYYCDDKTFLNILPLEMNYAGPREALHHALIRKNYGCTHMIIGRDHAGVGDYYDSYAAHDIFDNFTENELNIKILKYGNVSHCLDCGELKMDNTCNHGNKSKFHISGTKMREMIKNGNELPESLIRKEVSEYLLKHPNPFV